MSIKKSILAKKREIVEKAVNQFLNSRKSNNPINDKYLAGAVSINAFSHSLFNTLQETISFTKRHIKIMADSGRLSIMDGIVIPENYTDNSPSAKRWKVISFKADEGIVSSELGYKVRYYDSLLQTQLTDIYGGKSGDNGLLDYNKGAYTHFFVIENTAKKNTVRTATQKIMDNFIASLLNTKDDCGDYASYIVVVLSNADIYYTDSLEDISASIGENYFINEVDLDMSGFQLIDDQYLIIRDFSCYNKTIYYKSVPVASARDIAHEIDAVKLETDKQAFMNGSLIRLIDIEE